jgi:hypothetical protein
LGNLGSYGKIGARSSQINAKAKAPTVNVTIRRSLAFFLIWICLLSNFGSATHYCGFPPISSTPESKHVLERSSQISI